MALLTHLDITSGNYQQKFKFTVNASFSGISGDINSALVTVKFPTFLDIVPDDVGDPVKSVRVDADASFTTVTYDLGSITDLGISLRLGISAQFKLGTPNLTTFVSLTEMFINGESTESSESELVTLTVVPKWEITRQMILPTVSPAAGSEVYYKVTLSNTGDLGSSISDVVIRCFSADGFIIDDSYKVSGLDVSSSFADSTADGILGVFADNNLSFTIPKYSGNEYFFIYRAVLAESLEIGTEITTDMTLSATEIESQSTPDNIIISDAIYDASLSLYGPDYTLQGEDILYTFGFNNTSNQILNSCVFKNDLPQENSYYKFETGSFRINALAENISLEYRIDYRTLSGISGSFGSFNTDSNISIDLNEILGSDNLSSVTYIFPFIGVGVGVRNQAKIYGKVLESTETRSTITDAISLDFAGAGTTKTRSREKDTVVADICVLNPSISSSIGSSNLKPLDEYTMKLKFNCRNSRLLNPVVACFLPKELEFIGSESLSFSGAFGEGSPSLPIVELTENFAGTDQTLVKFQFVENFAYSFKQLANVTINFKVRVKIGSIGSISCFMLLATAGSTGFIPSSKTEYVQDSQISSYIPLQTNYVQTGNLQNSIILFASTASNKKIKGALDTDFTEEPKVGSTYEGGKLQYLISVTNTGNTEFTSVEIVDILPFIGDTGVILTGANRGSDFPVYAISEIYGLVNGDSKDFDIYYSTSSDPVRFGSSFNIIGTDDNWSKTVPDDITTLKSFKLVANDINLSPNDTLQILVNATVPVGVEAEKIAWNSFAADVYYRDEDSKIQRLLAIEPEKVGIKVNNTPEGTVEIGGLVYLDSNNNGEYDESEIYLNDVGVVVLNEKMQIIDATFTSPDFSGNNGSYLFKNLPAGKYYIRYFIDTNKYKFAQCNEITELIDMTAITSKRDLISCVIDKDKRTISDIAKANRSARGMVRDIVKNQMLLVMKQESVIDLIKENL